MRPLSCKVLRLYVCIHVRFFDGWLTTLALAHRIMNNISHTGNENLQVSVWHLISKLTSRCIRWRQMQTADRVQFVYCFIRFLIYIKSYKLSQQQVVEAYMVMICWGCHTAQTVGSHMAVRLSASRTGRTLLPRNILFCLWYSVLEAE
jgi:hypothetical protein